MKKTQNQSLGRNGENIASNFLQRQGHLIIQKNYRIGRSEIDIISLDNTTVVVSEVKSFFAPPWGAAEYRVNKKKQQQIIKGIYGFLDENPKYQGYDVRLDVIIVDFSKYPARIRHHKGAYYDNESQC